MAQGSSAGTGILIAGGGLAGLALAVALRQALGSAMPVVLCDPAAARDRPTDGRASAIAAGARRLLETLGAWQDVAPNAQPIHDMVITDSRLGDPVRPTFLTFGEEVEPGEPFAHMVENRDIVEALGRRAEVLGVDMRACGVASVVADGGQARAALGDGSPLSVALVAACDGGRSRLREQAGIRTVGWDYGQSGIVVTVGHEHDHEGRALEHFLPAGPFAVLPLAGRRSSIVWTESTATAGRLVALPPALFMDELERRFGHILGTLTLLDTPRALPLGLRIARRFVADRLALVGDAAHVIHPIAGQGLNMGLRDVAALAECVVEAARLGLDPGGADVLERYERWRRFDTVAMGVATDGLNRLFSNRSDILRSVRDLGLGLVDRMPQVKRFFVREAAGLVGEVPRLMRGEAL